MDDWGAYLYLVLRDIAYDLQSSALSLPELDIFLGPNYLVAFHHSPVDAARRLWNDCQKDRRLLQYGPAYLLYRLLDELNVDFMTAVDDLEDNLEELEDRVLVRPEPAFQERILRLKRIVPRLRRFVTLQREVVGQLARGRYRLIDDTDRLYYRDVYDHMVRLYELVDNARDLATAVLDVHLSVMNNRLNDIMKTLTIFTALFMPLTFITGFFGMNFFNPSSPSSPPGLPARPSPSPSPSCSCSPSPCSFGCVAGPGCRLAHSPAPYSYFNAFIGDRVAALSAG